MTEHPRLAILQDAGWAPRRFLASARPGQQHAPAKGSKAIPLDEVRTEAGKRELGQLWCIYNDQRVTEVDGQAVRLTSAQPMAGVALMVTFEEVDDV